uniref:Putative secreted protein n=1 Tax=Anopheles darlingi TaxID=43151 RepID=A0A2M4DDM3_ANODA
MILCYFIYLFYLTAFCGSVQSVQRSLSDAKYWLRHAALHDSKVQFSAGKSHGMYRYNMSDCLLKTIISGELK